MVRCHLSILMTRRRLRASDVARLTQLNRSTITALDRTAGNPPGTQS